VIRRDRFPFIDAAAPVRLPNEPVCNPPRAGYHP